MTLVIDASATAELLLGTSAGRAVARAVGHEDLVAPAHLPIEVASVVRGLSLGGHLDDQAAMAALSELAELRIELVPLEDVLHGVWQARHNLSAYDAAYVVVARRLGVPLLTLDRRLAAAAPDCAVLPET